MKEPKIRLKGFTREWEKKVVGDMGTTYSGLSGKTREDFGQGDASYVTFLNVLTNAQIDTSILEPVNVAKSEHQNLVKKGDLLFNTSSETPDEVGLCAVMDEDVENVYLNSFCFGFRVTDSNIDPKCVAYLMRSPIGRKLMSILGQGATRYNLSKNNFCKSDILLPSDKDEQESIAEYFQNLDSLIQSTKKKIESLKQVKAASLQSMFPQEGETTPRVRFKGCVGEWDVVTLKECLTINNERNQSNEYGIYDVLSVSDEVGVANQIKLLGRSYAGKSVSNYRILKTNQIVYTKSPLKLKPYGIVKVNNGPTGIVSVLYAIYDAKENVCADYIHYYFEPSYRINNYLLPLINKGAKNTMNISDEMALTGCITIPSYDEQKKISEYLKSLDSQIALLSQQLEKLQQIKSACLDKMFV